MGIGTLQLGEPFSRMSCTLLVSHWGYAFGSRIKEVARSLLTKQIIYMR